MKITFTCAHCGAENSVSLRENAETRVRYRTTPDQIAADYRRSVADLKARTVQPQPTDPDRPVAR